MAVETKLDWYKDAIIYELHVKTFRDSNADGIGDFKGLIEKLDHVAELGATAIWLLPFFVSPLKDDGYDIADYYNIHPPYGTLDDFKVFLSEAHRRDLKVIIELVLNHTSDQHPWFQRAIRSPKDSRERNYYVWSEDPSKFKDVRIIFQDFESSNWSWNEMAGQYYWHRFFHHQPDLNFDSEDVQREIFEVIDYWCKLGVDGFRLDAVPYLFERENTNGENLPETHQFLKKLRAYTESKYPGTLLLAEANMWPEDAAAYFGKGDECHMNYHFPLMPRMFMSIEMEDKHPISDIFEQTPAIPESCQWAIFLRNHDELTLEMVTDEERDYMYYAYARNPKAKINLGIRHRLAPLLENDRRKIELMNALMFSMPGTPVIYYGDEIGMGDNFHLGDRNGVRTPMQWSPDRNAGFSLANPQQLYLPIISDPAYHYEALNVETQRSNTSSLFWYMKRMIAARKQYQVFSRGELKFLKTDNLKILAFVRSYENEHVLVVINLSKFSQQAQIGLQDFSGVTPIELFSQSPFLPITSDKQYALTLGPHNFYWLKLSSGKQIPASPTNNYLRIDQLEDLFHAHEKERFEHNVLLPYLKYAPWLAIKTRTILSCKITQHIQLNMPGFESYLLLIRLVYSTGLPETVQLPIVLLKGSNADTVISPIIAEITNGQQKGKLVDGYYIKQFQQWLISKNENHLLSKKADLFWDEFSTKPQENLLVNIAEVHLGESVEQGLSLRFGKHLLLRIFRRVDDGSHPGIETIKYLQQHGFPHTADLLRTLEYRDFDVHFTLGCLYRITDDAVSGQEFIRQRNLNFIERLLALEDRKRFLSHVNYDFLKQSNNLVLDRDFATFIGNRGIEMVSLTGIRLAQAHKILAEGKEKNFIPERFSLHYQHSLYSSLRALSLRAMTLLESKKDQFPQWLAPENLILQRDRIITLLKRMLKENLNAQKIRLHGYFDLRHIVSAGSEVYLVDFGGDPVKHSSQRRLKRSSLWDVAVFIHSVFQTTYESFFNSQFLTNKIMKEIIPYAFIWSEYMSGYFLDNYLKTMEGSKVIPSDRRSIEIMLETYLIEASCSAIVNAADSNAETIAGSMALLETILNRNVDEAIPDLIDLKPDPDLQ